MNRRFGVRTIAFLLCFIYVFSTPLSVYAENGDSQAVEIEEAAKYLEPYEEAQETLEKVAEENEIYALVYLAESYAMKQQADPNSETVAFLASGQEVRIIGVGEDSGHNIWYQVSYLYDEGELEGFIKRDYLATSNEYLREWEAQYITDRSVSLFSLGPSSYPDIEQFPASYHNALYKLKDQYPDWTFVKMNTGIDFNYAINVQCEGDRSLIWAKTAEESWKNGMYDKQWAYCTPGIVKYYFDPRNSLTLETVFQFEHLGYNPSCNTEAVTQKAVDGTFMSGLISDSSKTYANVLTGIGANINISPILLASRIRQEQGNDGKSPLISGTYPGFESLYNYYNIGATGQTVEAVVRSGLTKAKEMGWTDRIKALTGGANFLLKNYIAQGQDTLYLQKFDVDNRHNGILWHQYMQNIQAPTTEAKSTYNTYKKTGLLNDMPFVFRIPVYNNMPEYACIKPGSEDKLTLSTTNIENLPVDAEAVLTIYLNGAQNTTVEMSFSSSDTSVAKVDEKGVIIGISPGTATITCKKKENPASANTASCTVTVVKADIDMDQVEKPVLEELVYSPNTTLKNIALPNGFTWVDDSIVPTVENTGYSVMYNPDGSKYNSLVLTLPLTVKKAQLTLTDITIPSGLTAAAGAQLKAAALPAGYTWDAPETALPKKTGTYQYTASYCSDVANYEVLTGISIEVTVVCKTHEFGEWEGNHADCENDGKLVRTCTICGEQEMVTEPATGHSYESKVTKEPTQTDTGVRTYTCKLCQDSYTEEIPKLEPEHKHNYTEKVTKEPTCTEKGEKTFTCSCKDSYTETLDPLGHNIVDGACTRCDYVEPALPEHKHNYTVSTITATCVKAGAKIYTCSCGDTYSEEIKALGHDMKGGKCTRCGYMPDSPEESKPSSSEQESKPSSSEESSKPSSSEQESKPSSSEESSKPSSSEQESKPSSSEGSSKPSSGKPESKPSSSANDSQPAVSKPAESAVPKPQSSKPGSTVHSSSVQKQQDSEQENGAVNTEEKLQTVQINMKDSTVLDTAKLARVKESDKKLQLNMPGAVTWSITLDSIKDRSQLNVDMAVVLGKADIPKDVITKVSEDGQYELLRLEHEGSFGFDAVLTVPVKKQYMQKTANLFYYNPETDDLEFIDDSKVTSEGYASFEMKHASEYVIVFADASLEMISEQTQPEDTSIEETEMTEVSVPEAKEGFDKNIVIIVAVVILLIAAIIAVVLFMKKRNAKEDYFFDEEDDPDDSLIK